MSRRVLSLGLALLLALAGTGLVLSYVAAADERALAGQEPISVLVVKQPVLAGTSVAVIIEEDLVELRELPQDSVPAGALADVESVAELVTSTDLHPGEVLLAARFTSPTVAGALAIPEGQMAVSVELTDPGRVAGFVRPGSEVAVFDTFEPPGAETEEATRVLLPRVKVLAAGPVAVAVPGAGAAAGGDQTSGADPDPAETPVTTSILTLAVDQAQAEKLVHATHTGRLYFGLLTPTSTSGPSAGTTTSTLFQ